MTHSALRGSSSVTMRFSAVVSRSFRTRNSRLLFTHAQKQIGQKRFTHSKRHVSTTISISEDVENKSIDQRSKPSSMACLPLSSLIRSYMITSMSSIPLLLRPSLAALQFLATTKSNFLNADKNPLLGALVKNTFYAQFCAGQNKAEVHRGVDQLKSLGYRGIILTHATDAVLTKEEEATFNTMEESKRKALNVRQIETWKQYTLDTINLTQEGDIVAIKYSGAGKQAVIDIGNVAKPQPELDSAMHEICQAAKKQGVVLLVDAERAALQKGVENWTLHYQDIYNKGGKALVYGTYQTYLKRMPETLAQHLAEARKHDFTLGIKLVRGAYVSADPRHLIWDTIEDTHRCFDELAECLMRRQYGGLLQPTTKEDTTFPQVDVVLATHNAESVERASTIRDQMARNGEPLIHMTYGQLMGMADNVSLALVQKARERKASNQQNIDIPQVYKYMPWGTTRTCMRYLSRRAMENSDAVTRTVEVRKALGKELARRIGLARQS